MNLIAIEYNREARRYFGFVEKENTYQEFIIDGDNKVDLKAVYPKKQYKDYRHFVGTMSKFMPEVFFLINPIEISELTGEEVSKAWNKLNGV